MNTWTRDGRPLHMVKCVLGEEYIVRRWDRKIKGKLIKVTNKGYNFLHEPSNQCIYPRHWYIPVKWQKDCQGPTKIFIVPAEYTVKAVNKGR
jgi:hypothetical protein